jgi:hypothetical protein
MSVRDRTAADLPPLVDMLRRVHEADGYWIGPEPGGGLPSAIGLRDAR